MRRKTALIVIFFLLGFAYGGQAGKGSWNRGSGAFQVEPTFAEEKGDKPDIQWFKDQLKISPKYTEDDTGVLGVSLSHFLIMVFLILFFIVGLLAVVIRRKRTRELLMLLLKEESQGQSKKR